MGWKPIHFGLAGMMLIFGSFNTLSVKWADTMKRWALILCNLCENNFWPLLSFSESVDGTMKHFNHPFLQVSLTNLSPQYGPAHIVQLSPGLWYVPGRDALHVGLLDLSLLQKTEARGKPLCWYWCRGNAAKAIQPLGIPPSSPLWYDRNLRSIHRSHPHLCVFVPGI